MNTRLLREQRVRVIGGDGKVDWTAIKQPKDLLPLMNRGGNIREIIATQVLEPRLKLSRSTARVIASKSAWVFPASSRRKPGILADAVKLHQQRRP